jgi:hypothetical protein
MDLSGTNIDEKRGEDGKGKPLKIHSKPSRHSVLSTRPGGNPLKMRVSCLASASWYVNERVSLYARPGHDAANPMAIVYAVFTPTAARIRKIRI